MSEPQPGQYHDLYEIKKHFTELCAVLKEAAINTIGIFLNADAGFDSQELRSVCSEKEIEANIKPNLRNKKNTMKKNIILMKNCIKKELLLGMQMLGWTAIKQCLSDMKPYPETGWPCTG